MSSTITLQATPSSAGFICTGALVVSQPVTTSAVMTYRFPRALPRCLDDGRIHFGEDLVDGFENTFTTFRRLFDGTHQGKLIINIDDR